MGPAEITALAALAATPSVTALTKGTIDAAAALWTSLCKPSFDAIGIAAKDFTEYRLQNWVAVTARAAARFSLNGVDPETVHVHPRLGIAVINQSQWAENEVVRNMWAGLLVSSATEKGDDEGNLMFTDLLSRLTSSQARIFKYACESAQKQITDNGLVGGSYFYLAIEALTYIAEMDDLRRVDRELDHLRALGLLGPHAGIDYRNPTLACLEPSPLGLQMFAACSGARDPVAFYKVVSGAPSFRDDETKPSDPDGGQG